MRKVFGGDEEEDESFGSWRAVIMRGGGVNRVRLRHNARIEAYLHQLFFSTVNLRNACCQNRLKKKKKTASISSGDYNFPSFPHRILYTEDSDTCSCRRMCTVPP